MKFLVWWVGRDGRHLSSASIARIGMCAWVVVMMWRGKEEEEEKNLPGASVKAPPRLEVGTIRGGTHKTHNFFSSFFKISFFRKDLCPPPTLCRLTNTRVSPQSIFQVKKAAPHHHLPSEHLKGRSDSERRRHTKISISFLIPSGSPSYSYSYSYS
jgi:hypothetical protein